MSAGPELILASGSRVRADMLRRAGLAFTVLLAPVDEDEVKAAFKADDAPVEDCAVALAELKATRVSARHPDALVIGADQILDLDGQWFDKPKDMAEARSHLARLSGRTHRLVTGAVVARDGTRLWHTLDEARLTIRNLSDAALDTYLGMAGEQVLSSVGAYQLEGLGSTLFSRVEGDFFTILGLPLLSLLTFLREHGVGLP
jgi:septum formation protein